jgi:hypothetical protein
MKQLIDKSFMGLIFIMLGVLLTHILLNTAMAAGIIVPEVNPFETLAELISNWGSMSGLAKGMVFVLVTVQIVKQASDFQHKRLVVLLASIMYGIGQLVMAGQSVSASIIAVLVSGGGAMALYEFIKPALKKYKFFSFLELGK